MFGLSLQATVPAVSGSLVLNEIAAVNRGSVRNGPASPDWIELFNGGSQTLDLGGMGLSDDVLQPNRFVFTSGTRIPAQGYLTVWCDTDTNAAGLHTGFGLSSEGQTLVLSSQGPTGTVIHARSTLAYRFQT